MTSGSDVVEAQDYGPPADGYHIVAKSGLLYENDSLKEAWSPSRKLEDVEVGSTATEGHCGLLEGAQIPRPTKRLGFTSTPVPRHSGKSSWEQYRQVFAATVCSNGWDDATAALQLLSHLDGDALNVALLIPESQRVVSGGLMKSLSEHYGSPGRLAEYKRQFRRAFRRPDDDPSIFAIELDTLARRAFADGQAECALRRYLDSFGPDTPMRDIVDSCRVWKSYNEAAVRRQDGSDRNSPQAVYQVTEVSQSPAVSTESETFDEVIRWLLPMATVPLPKVAPIPSHMWDMLCPVG